MTDLRVRRAHTSFIQSSGSLLSNEPIYHNPHFDQHLNQSINQSTNQSISQSKSRSSLDEIENRTRESREQYLSMSIEEVGDWLESSLNHTNQSVNQSISQSADKSISHSTNQSTQNHRKLVSFVPSTNRRESLLIEREEQIRRSEAVRLNDQSMAPPVLFDALQTGALLCELAIAIEPGLSIKYKKNAAPGTFLARDNIENFIKAAIKWGVPRSQIFEVDDLVMRKNDRAVINSLLDITRVVYLKFQVEPPQLVKYEFEIAEIEAHQEPEPAPEPIIEPISQPISEPEPIPEPQLQPVYEPEPQPEPEPEPVEPPKPKGPRYLPYIADPADPLDTAVGAMVNKYALDLLMKRVAKGQYYIGETKVHHLRLVRHLVLVRVGGGWEPLVPMASRKIQEQFI